MTGMKLLIISMGLLALMNFLSYELEARVADPEKEVMDELSSLSLEALMDVPVYAASRRGQGMNEAPSTVTVFTYEEIKSHGWRTLGDILNAALGIYISDDRNYGYVGIRGFLRPGDYNSRLLVLVNGLRINEGITTGVGGDRTFPVDVGLIERVEIVRGPSSSLYGFGRC